MSLFWVVYCHGHQYLSSVYINFLHFIPVSKYFCFGGLKSIAILFQWAEYPFTSFFVHGFFSVDSFFVIGGLLVALITLRSMDKYDLNFYF